AALGCFFGLPAIATLAGLPVMALTSEGRAEKALQPEEEKEIIDILRCAPIRCLMLVFREAKINFTVTADKAQSLAELGVTAENRGAFLRALENQLRSLKGPFAPLGANLLARWQKINTGSDRRIARPLSSPAVETYSEWLSDQGKLQIDSQYVRTRRSGDVTEVTVEEKGIALVTVPKGSKVTLRADRVMTCSLIAIRAVNRDGELIIGLAHITQAKAIIESYPSDKTNIIMNCIVSHLAERGAQDIQIVVLYDPSEYAATDRPQLSEANRDRARIIAERTRRHSEEIARDDAFTKGFFESSASITTEGVSLEYKHRLSDTIPDFIPWQAAGKPSAGQDSSRDSVGCFFGLPIMAMTMDSSSDAAERIRARERIEREITWFNRRLAGISKREESLTRLISALANGGRITPKRVLSDLHGNYRRFMQALGFYRTIRELILLGDYMDRDSEGVKVYEEVRRQVENGAIALFGNHELLTVLTLLGEGSKFYLMLWMVNHGMDVFKELGIFPKDLNEKDLREKARVVFFPPLAGVYHTQELKVQYFEQLFPGVLDRLLAIAKSNEKLKEIAIWYQQNLKLYYLDKFGTLFVHAGVPVDDITGHVFLEYKGWYGLAALDQDQKDLRNAQNSSDEAFKFLDKSSSVLNIRDWAIPNILPMHTKNIEERNQRILDELGVNRIVFGHDPQKDGVLNVDNHFFCIDRGMANYYQGAGGFLVFDSYGFLFYDFVDKDRVKPTRNVIVTSPNLLEMSSKELAALGERRESFMAQRALLRKELALLANDPSGSSPANPHLGCFFGLPASALSGLIEAGPFLAATDGEDPIAITTPLEMQKSLAIAADALYVRILDRVGPYFFAPHWYNKFIGKEPSSGTVEMRFGINDGSESSMAGGWVGFEVRLDERGLTLCHLDIFVTPVRHGIGLQVYKRLAAIVPEGTKLEGDLYHEESILYLIKLCIAHGVISREDFIKRDLPAGCFERVAEAAFSTLDELKNFLSRSDVSKWRSFSADDIEDPRNDMSRLRNLLMIKLEANTAHFTQEELAAVPIFMLWEKAGFSSERAVYFSPFSPSRISVSSRKGNDETRPRAAAENTEPNAGCFFGLPLMAATTSSGGGAAKSQSPKRIVVALGGNDFVRLEKMAETIADLIAAGFEIVITHGNGPQAGDAAIREELAASLKAVRSPPRPLDQLDADTEGCMGYLIERTLRNVFVKRGIAKDIVVIPTQVLIDKEDPLSKKPTKPIGPFYTQEEKTRHEAEKGWTIAERKEVGADNPKRFRRVVPSPNPLSIIEIGSIKRLVDSGTIVIACGGGGIPVYRDEKGMLQGFEGVIDKDRASKVLALELGVDGLVILTGTDAFYRDFNKPTQQRIPQISVSEIRDILRNDPEQAPAGSMGPKLEACADFVEHSGSGFAIITDAEHAIVAFEGSFGTKIVKDNLDLDSGRDLARSGTRENLSCFIGLPIASLTQKSVRPETDPHPVVDQLSSQAEDYAARIKRSLNILPAAVILRNQYSLGDKTIFRVPLDNAGIEISRDEFTQSYVDSEVFFSGCWMLLTTLRKRSEERLSVFHLDWSEPEGAFRAQNYFGKLQDAGYELKQMLAITPSVDARFQDERRDINSLQRKIFKDIRAPDSIRVIFYPYCWQTNHEAYHSGNPFQEVSIFLTKDGIVFIRFKSIRAGSFDNSEHIIQEIIGFDAPILWSDIGFYPFTKDGDTSRQATSDSGPVGCFFGLPMMATTVVKRELPDRDQDGWRHWDAKELQELVEKGCNRPEGAVIEHMAFKRGRLRGENSGDEEDVEGPNGRGMGRHSRRGSSNNDFDLGCFFGLPIIAVTDTQATNTEGRSDRKHASFSFGGILLSLFSTILVVGTIESLFRLGPPDISTDTNRINNGILDSLRAAVSTDTTSKLPSIADSLDAEWIMLSVYEQWFIDAEEWLKAGEREKAALAYIRGFILKGAEIDLPGFIEESNNPQEILKLTIEYLDQVALGHFEDYMSADEKERLHQLIYALPEKVMESLPQSFTLDELRNVIAEELRRLANEVPIEEHPDRMERMSKDPLRVPAPLFDAIPDSLLEGETNLDSGNLASPNNSLGCFFGLPVMGLTHSSDEVKLPAAEAENEIPSGAFSSVQVYGEEAFESVLSGQDITYWTIQEQKYQQAGLRGYLCSGLYEFLISKIKPLLPRRGSILDVMSGEVTLVDIYPSFGLSVHGIGAVEESLRRNGMLDSFQVQDLNDNPQIVHGNLFDAAIISLGINYSKRPLELLRSIHRLLKPGGRVIIVCSTDRHDGSRLVKIWRHPERFGFANRVDLIRDYLEMAGGFEIEVIMPEGEMYPEARVNLDTNGFIITGIKNDELDLSVVPPAALENPAGVQRDFLTGPAAAEDASGLGCFFGLPAIATLAVLPVMAVTSESERRVAIYRAPHKDVMVEVACGEDPDNLTIEEVNRRAANFKFDLFRRWNAALTATDAITSSGCFFGLPMMAVTSGSASPSNYASSLSKVEHCQRVYAKFASAPGSFILSIFGLPISFNARKKSLRKELAKTIASSLTSGQRVLSVGVGSGLLERELIDEYGMQVVGVDLVRPLLKKATKRGIVAVAADGERLPFADGSFDSIIFAESIGHMKLEVALSEAYRVLSPGGSIHILTYLSNTDLLSNILYEAHIKSTLYYALENAGFRDNFGFEPDMACRSYCYLFGVKPAQEPQELIVPGDKAGILTGKLSSQETKTRYPELEPCLGCFFGLPVMAITKEEINISSPFNKKVLSDEDIDRIVFINAQDYEKEKIREVLRRLKQKPSGWPTWLYHFFVSPLFPATHTKGPLQIEVRDYAQPRYMIEENKIILSRFWWKEGYYFSFFDHVELEKTLWDEIGHITYAVARENRKILESDEQGEFASYLRFVSQATRLINSTIRKLLGSRYREGLQIGANPFEAPPFIEVDYFQEHTNTLNLYADFLFKHGLAETEADILSSVLHLKGVEVIEGEQRGKIRILTAVTLGSPTVKIRDGVVQDGTLWLDPMALSSKDKRYDLLVIFDGEREPKKIGEVYIQIQPERVIIEIKDEMDGKFSQSPNVLLALVNFVCTDNLKTKKIELHIKYVPRARRINIGILKEIWKIARHIGDGGIEPVSVFQHERQRDEGDRGPKSRLGCFFGLPVMAMTESKEDEAFEATLQYLSRLPKQDLHFHLDGSLPAELILKLLWRFPEARRRLVEKIFRNKKVSDYESEFRKLFGAPQDEAEVARVLSRWDDVDLNRLDFD
ncbi:MAG: methyltransferase domain-containing protein, partial [Candidatus Omnitrophica bacterium]|nr:methyltransferase domain-containing protein [Candidatus Omnitrophota bacterium]